MTERLVISHSQQEVPFKHLELRMRKPTYGPEMKLIDNYIESYLPEPPHGQALTIFVEPKVDSSFPDVVAVYWRTSTASRWNFLREQVCKTDLQVLHYLVLSGVVQGKQVADFFPPAALASLERLQNFGLASEVEGAWQSESLHEIFAIDRLIAIEAKMTEWRIGLRQAARNTWFASESYLLLPSLPRSGQIMQEAKRYGVGIITERKSLDQAEAVARPEHIPRSYASWLFNEWVWRSDHLG